MRQPHPFARFINILGRGKSLTRSLTIEEAEEAMGMILRGETLPEQLGAFLMLLRVKEESPAEIAGFVRAARAATRLPANAPKVDVDWSSYAGKGRQLPWFILSALILSRNGWRVFMHGAEAHTEGRVYTGAALGALGHSRGGDPWRGGRCSRRAQFRLSADRRFEPEARRDARTAADPGPALAGAHFRPHAQPVRRARMLQGVFHPGYMAIHRGAGPAGAARFVFRGEGGEIERRPGKPTDVMMAFDGAPRGRALAADDRRAAPGAGPIDGPRPARRAVARGD